MFRKSCEGKFLQELINVNINTTQRYQKVPELRPARLSGIHYRKLYALLIEASSAVSSEGGHKARCMFVLSLLTNSNRSK